MWSVSIRKIFADNDFKYLNTAARVFFSPISLFEPETDCSSRATARSMGNYLKLRGSVKCQIAGADCVIKGDSFSFPGMLIMSVVSVRLLACAGGMCERVLQGTWWVSLTYRHVYPVAVLVTLIVEFCAFLSPRAYFPELFISLHPVRFGFLSPGLDEWDAGVRPGNLPPVSDGVSVCLPGGLLPLPGISAVEHQPLGPVRRRHAPRRQLRQKAYFPPGQQQGRRVGWAGAHDASSLHATMNDLNTDKGVFIVGEMKAQRPNCKKLTPSTAKLEKMCPCSCRHSIRVCVWGLFHCWRVSWL